MLNETAVLFHFPMESIMRVTHHRCPKQCRKYIVDTNWDDLEEQAHIARTFNLWAQGYHVPVIGTSTPDLVARMNQSLKRMILQKSFRQEILLQRAQKYLRILKKKK